MAHGFWAIHPAKDSLNFLVEPPDMGKAGRVECKPFWFDVSEMEDLAQHKGMKVGFKFADLKIVRNAIIGANFLGRHIKVFAYCKTYLGDQLGICFLEMCQELLFMYIVTGQKIFPYNPQCGRMPRAIPVKSISAATKVDTPAIRAIISRSARIASDQKSNQTKGNVHATIKPAAHIRQAKYVAKARQEFFVFSLAMDNSLDMSEKQLTSGYYLLSGFHPQEKAFPKTHPPKA